MFANLKFGQIKFADNQTDYPTDFVEFSQGHSKSEDSQLGEEAEK